MKIKEEKPNTIQAYDLEDGQIAIITEWDGDYYLGRIVQRYKDILIVLGKDSGKSFTTALIKPNENLRVRVLESGTLLEI